MTTTDDHIKKQAFQNYLRFGKVRQYLDAVYFAQRKLTREVKRLTGISLREVKFLLQVEVNPGCSLVSVQKHQLLPSSTAAWLADNLVKKGLMLRRQNPNNRREVILELSPAGHALLGRIQDQFLTPDVEERLNTTPDQAVINIEKSLATLCELYGVESK
ncbi:MAG: MarR family transcriptional regulator [Candidatus Lernaella stagnicola]|nr:MarR family transcriptional regulator [Candidatus Lernaella stagnicola]